MSIPIAMLLLALAVAAVFSTLVGALAGALALLGGARPSAAIARAVVAFGGTFSLALAVLVLIHEALIDAAQSG
jgi:hypothetical protein